jgi:hypothetical protein
MPASRHVKVWRSISEKDVKDRHRRQRGNQTEKAFQRYGGLASAHYSLTKGSVLYLDMIFSSTT